MNAYKIWMSAVAGVLLIGAMLNPARADTDDLETPEPISSEVRTSLGYRGTSLDDNAGRAREYDSLESSPLLNLKLFTDRGGYHLDFSGEFLSDKEYAVEAHLDTEGLVRLDLRTNRFFHNLDHIPYDNGYAGGESYPPPATPPATVPPLTRTQVGAPAEGSRPDARFNNAYRAYYTDHNPADDYGLRLDMSEAKLKVKCPDYPAHVTLSYWRFEKEGEKQLRFVGENCTTACHMQSKSRDIDRVTEEVKAGVDAHVGFIDLALEALIRTFRDHESVPVDSFGAHNRGRRAGEYEHSEDPDSKLSEVTLRMNTAPSGGLVGSASFSLGERENKSDLASVAPVDAETDYARASADVTYTPSENWTMNFRYRLFDLDNDHTNTFTNSGSTNPNPLEVREAMDITRAWYEAIASYRPNRHLTVKAEMRREEIDRSDTGPATQHVSSATAPVVIVDNWELPEEEVLTQVRLGFISRLFDRSALKLSGWAALRENDDPAYGISYSHAKELFLSAFYTPSPLWGLSATLNALNEENDDHAMEQFDRATTPNTPVAFDLEREHRQQRVALGAWLTPREDLSIDLNYGFLRTAIDQDLLFGAEPNSANALRNYTIEDEDVAFRQSVQTVMSGVTWRPVEQVSCRLEGYHIRSKANYAPEFATSNFQYLSGTNVIPGTASSSDLRGISKLDLRQNGLRGRVSWDIDTAWSCAVEATYDSYDELGSDVFDGSVQTAMVSFSRSW